MSRAARTPLGAVRLVLRIGLVVALAVLLALNGVKQAPRIIALASAQQAVPSTAAAQPATVAPVVTATAGTVESPAPTIDVPSIDTGTRSGSQPGAGSGSGSGTGTSGGGTRTTPTPKPVAPVITSLRTEGTPSCPNATPAPGTNPTVSVFWTSTGAVTATFSAIAVNTPDSVLDGFQPSDSLSWEYPCPAAQQTYTVTVIAKDGRTASKSVVVTAGGG